MLPSPSPPARPASCPIWSDCTFPSASFIMRAMSDSSVLRDSSGNVSAASTYGIVGEP